MTVTNLETCDAMAELSVGIVIHGYSLIKLIDNTKNARIFEAQDTHTSKHVCIKFITYDRNNATRVDEEIKMMKNLNSPYIIKAIDTFDHAQYKCVVMPLAKSDLIESCKEYKGHKMPESTVKVIAQRGLKALKYLHSKHICHRDVKPDNFLWIDYEDETNVFLADLGFAKQFKTGEKCKEYIGTLDYAAPEIVQGIPYNETVDIWSFGVTLYLLLGGVAPFPRTPEYTLRRCISKGSYIFPASQMGSISDDAKDLIRHMIQVDPLKRWTPDECLSHKWFSEIGTNITLRQTNSR